MKRIIILFIFVGSLGFSGKAQVLTLDSCKFYALQNNKRIKEAAYECDAAEQVRKNAFTAYFPKVEAGALAMKANRYLMEGEIPEMNLPVYDGNPANLANPTQFTYFPGMNLELLDYANAGFVTAIQPLYAGNRVRTGNKLASLGEEFKEYQLNLTTEEVLVATETYYWTILSLNEKLKTINGYRNLLNSLLNDVTVAYEAGLTQKSDVLKVQLELNKIDANKLKLDNGLSLVKMALAQHIGIGFSEDINVEDTVIEIVSPVKLFVNPDEALKGRNEYRMLNKAVDAEVLQKQMAMGDYMPSLAVGVQGLYLDMMEDQNTYGLAFATVSIPISGWWGGSHKIQEHQIKINIAQNNLEEKSELLLLQIDKAYKNLNESYQQIAVSESAVNQAKEHLSIVKDNYDAGVVNTSDLLEAQALYQATMDALTDAKTAYRISQAEYYKVTDQLY